MAQVVCMPCLATRRTASARTAPVVGHSVILNSSSLLTGGAKVIPFTAHRLPRLEVGSAETAAGSEFSETRNYSRPESGADDHHRMLENVFAAIIATVLIVAGSWMLNTIVSSWPG